MRTLGVISDTHGLLRPSAIEALRGSDLIVHAGDVGKPDILDALRQVAPVVAVRGNVDGGDWADALRETETVEFGQHRLYVLHRLQDLDLDATTAGFAAVIYGHTHQPEIEQKDGVLFFNPGSAGPRRFSLPISLGRLSLVDGKLSAELIELAE